MARKKHKVPMPGSLVGVPTGLGKIEFYWADGGVPACEFNRLAITARGELLMVSFITSPKDRKLIATMTAAGAAISKLGITAWGINVITSTRTSRRPGRLSGSADGYNLHFNRLGFNCEHVLLITRNPSFLKVNSSEELWSVLTSDRHTTPLLPEWLPYIRETLIKLGHLESALTHGCQCGLLNLRRATLDDIVIEGLRKRKIAI